MVKLYHYFFCGFVVNIPVYTMYFVISKLVCITFDPKHVRSIHFTFHRTFPVTYCSEICERSIFIAQIFFHVKHTPASISLHQLPCSTVCYRCVVGELSEIQTSPDRCCVYIHLSTVEMQVFLRQYLTHLAYLLFLISLLL